MLRTDKFICLTVQQKKKNKYEPYAITSPYNAERHWHHSLRFHIYFPFSLFVIGCFALISFRHFDILPCVGSILWSKSLDGWNVERAENKKKNVGFRVRIIINRWGCVGAADHVQDELKWLRLRFIRFGLSIIIFGPGINEGFLI